MFVSRSRTQETVSFWASLVHLGVKFKDRSLRDIATHVISVHQRACDTLVDAMGGDEFSRSIFKVVERARRKPKWGAEIVKDFDSGSWDLSNIVDSIPSLKEKFYDKYDPMGHIGGDYINLAIGKTGIHIALDGAHALVLAQTIDEQLDNSLVSYIKNRSPKTFAKMITMASNGELDHLRFELAHKFEFAYTSPQCHGMAKSSYKGVLDALEKEKTDRATFEKKMRSAVDAEQEKILEAQKCQSEKTQVEEAKGEAEGAKERAEEAKEKAEKAKESAILRRDNAIHEKEDAILEKEDTANANIVLTNRLGEMKMKGDTLKRELTTTKDVLKHYRNSIQGGPMKLIDEADTSRALATSLLARIASSPFYQDGTFHQGFRDRLRQKTLESKQGSSQAGDADTKGTIINQGATAPVSPTSPVSPIQANVSLFDDLKKTEYHVQNSGIEQKPFILDIMDKNTQKVVKMWAVLTKPSQPKS
jgi:hypothetical protein